MRATDGLQTTIAFGSVNLLDQTISLELSLGMSLPMPLQDEHLPDQIESYVHQAGLEFQRRLFEILIEKADQELVLQQRYGKGGAGIQRRGTRPFTFKTIFGEVTVWRSRILHKKDGTIEMPSAIAWKTSHQLMHRTSETRFVINERSIRGRPQRRCEYGDEDLVGGHDHRHRASESN